MRRTFALVAAALTVMMSVALAAEQNFQQQQMETFRRHFAQAQNNLANCKNTKRPADCSAIEKSLLDNARTAVAVLRKWDTVEKKGDNQSSWAAKVEYYEVLVVRKQSVRDHWRLNVWNNAWSVEKYATASTTGTWAKGEIETAVSQRDGYCELDEDEPVCRAEWDSYRTALERVIPASEKVNHARDIGDKDGYYDALVEEAKLQRDYVAIEAKLKIKYFPK